MHKYDKQIEEIGLAIYESKKAGEGFGAPINNYAALRMLTHLKSHVVTGTHDSAGLLIVHSACAFLTLGYDGSPRVILNLTELLIDATERSRGTELHTAMVTICNKVLLILVAVRAIPLNQIIEFRSARIDYFIDARKLFLNPRLEISISMLSKALPNL